MRGIAGSELLGLMPATAYVVASDAPNTIKEAALAAKAHYGNLIQLCDGVADNVEIQAAIAALPAGGGKIVLSAGNFVTAANIAVPASVTLEGQGKATVVTATGAAITNAISIIDVNNSSVKNMKVVLAAGAGTGGTRPNIIYGETVARLWLENLWLVGDITVGDDGSLLRQNGILLNVGTYSKIINCLIQNNKRHGIHLFNTSNNNTVAGNTCQGNSWNGIYLTSNCNNNTLTGNSCLTNTGVGLWLGDGICCNNTASGNTCQGNGDDGIVLRNGCINNTISGNTCQGNGAVTGAQGITLWGGCDDNVITGNVCNGNNYYGISVTECLRNTITGNVCRGNTKHGLFLFRSSYCVVAGNVVTGNGTAAHDGIQVWGDGGPVAYVGDGRADYNLIIGNVIQGNAQFGINVVGGGYTKSNSIRSNYSLGNASGNIADTGIATIINGNDGYLAKGELREYARGLAAVVQNGAIIAWQNPEAQAALVTAIVRITTGGGAAATGPMGLTTSVVVEDCEDAWDESVLAEVTSTLNTTDFERGAGSAQLAVAAGVVDDEILATEARAAQDLSTYTHLLFKIKSSVAVAAADLRMLISENINCGAPAETLDVPALVANVWTLVVVPFVNAGATRDAIISIGLQYHDNPQVCTILIDDVRAVTVGTTMFAGAAVDINAAAIYDSMNVTDAGAGQGKPIAIDAKNGTNDVLVMVATGGAANAIVGSYYIKLVGQ